MPKSDSTSDAVVVGAAALLVYLLWPRGGRPRGSASIPILSVSVLADDYVFGAESFTSCAALLAALPPGDIVIDPELGEHAAVVDLQTCLAAAGRKVSTL